MKKILGSSFILILLVVCTNNSTNNNQNNTIQVVMEIENYGEITIELY